MRQPPTTLVLLSVAPLIIACSDVTSPALASDPTSPLPIPEGQSARDPEPPRAYIDTRLVPASGATRQVRAGEDLQAALNAAQPGDVLLLEAGTVFTGNFVLPAKTGGGDTQWITIRTATPDAQLPAAGTRLNPTYAPLLPKIVSPNSVAAIRTAPSASYWRLVGLEITVGSAATTNYGIVLLGDGSSAQNNADIVPHHLVLDRVYVHGHGALNVSRCVAFNSAWSAVIDSYLAECHAKGWDSQAIGGWNGPGPFKIVNNYLEGAGENVMFGGADPAIANLTPSDIEIRRNHFTRPASWKGVWTVKNLFELKHAQRVLVEGNVFENHWADAQDGFAIVWKSVNQSGTAPWSVVQDVTFRRNRLRNVGAGINLAAKPESHPAVPASRFKIADNVFDNINVGAFTGHGRLFQLLGGPADVNIEHNTMLHSGTSNAAVMMDGATPQMARFVFRDNVITRASYGVFGSGAGEGTSALAYYAEPGYVFRRNLVIGAPTSTYPADNFFPTTIVAVGFVNAAAGNYRLAASSPYANAASDGRHPGADVDAVDAATQGVVRP